MFFRFIYFLSLFFIISPANSVEISPLLIEESSQKSHLDFIVYLNESADLTPAFSILNKEHRVSFVYQKLVKKTQDTQKPLRQFFAKNKVRSLSFFSQNAIAVYGYPTSLLTQLLNFKEVKFIGPNVRTKLNLPEPLPQSSEKILGVSSHLRTVKADQAWEQFNVRGKGIVVAGQDTGFYWQHNALKKKYRGYSVARTNHNYNWLDAIGVTENSPCSPGGASPCDDRDHGTHTLGIMVGDDESGNQIGVAPEAQWMGCRNMKSGVGTVASYLLCFDFFLAPYPIGGDPQKDGRPELAPHIVNNSWTCPKSEGCRGDEFAQVIQAYKAAGILLVVAAGNDGPGCGTASSQPSTYAGDLITVGAWNPYMSEVAFFSGRGPSPLNGQLSPNLIAPGGAVRSSMASGANVYDDKTGTSMASPHIAGAAALLWSFKPELVGQVDMTIDILQKTAQPIRANQNCDGFSGNQIPNATAGYGMLDILEALKSVQ